MFGSPFFRACATLEDALITEKSFVCPTYMDDALFTADGGIVFGTNNQYTNSSNYYYAPLNDAYDIASASAWYTKDLDFILQGTDHTYDFGNTVMDWSSDGMILFIYSNELESVYAWRASSPWSVADFPEYVGNYTQPLSYYIASSGIGYVYQIRVINGKLVFATGDTYVYTCDYTLTAEGITLENMTQIALNTGTTVRSIDVTKTGNTILTAGYTGSDIRSMRLSNAFDLASANQSSLVTVPTRNYNMYAPSLNGDDSRFILTDYLNNEIVEYSMGGTLYCAG